MDRFHITGPTRLAGRVEIGGAKNAALPALAASLLTDATLELSGRALAPMVLSRTGIEFELQGRNLRSLQPLLRYEDLPEGPFQVAARLSLERDRRSRSPGETEVEVEEAFVDQPRVMTLSIHEKDRWPYSGAADDRRSGGARNFPVPRGFNDAELHYLVDHAVLPIAERFAPNALVLCCGADSLAGDFLDGDGANLPPQAH